MAIIRGPLPTDEFTILRNSWLRDRRLSLADKGLLAYIASHAIGYRLTLQQIVAENANGYDAINATIKRLERVGYLLRSRNRGVDGTLGSYDWHLTDASQARDQSGFSNTGSDQEERGVSAGHGQSGFSHTGSDQGIRESSQVTTSPGFPSLENPGPKKNTDKKISSLEDQEKPPPTPRAERRPTPDSRRDEGGREDPRQTPQATQPTQPARPAAQLVDEPPAPPATPVDPIAATVAEATTHQPTWTRSATRAALTQAIAEGMDQGVATKALIDIATGVYGPTIAGPQRLLAAGPWRQPGTVFVPAPPRDERATCRRHRGQPADHCRVCASERLAPPDPQEATPAPMRATTARAAARETIANAAARWTQNKRTRVHAVAPAT